MLISRFFAIFAAATAFAVAADAEQIGFGPNPKLPPPESSWLPTINVARAKGWPDGVKPQPAPGLDVTPFATGLDHPRWLHVLPNGDVLVAEASAPEHPPSAPESDRGWTMGYYLSGIRNWIIAYYLRKAGARVKSANRIILLRPKPNGAAEMHVFLEGLNSPFGMALVGDALYVANTDALLKFPYKEGDLKITAAPKKVADLPAGPINFHWTRNILATKDGARLFVAVGSNSNVPEKGVENEESRAAILEVDAESGATRVFASGLRNPVGMALEPSSNELFAVVNEREGYGDDLVPDYLTSVKGGAFYGWPYSYFGQHVDVAVTPQRPDMVAKAIAPDYALGGHTASLGLAFGPASALPERYGSGAFIGQHGSWNRRQPSGYKVIFVPFADGKPNGQPLDVLTGFLDHKGNALGRPVGVEVAKDGALLVADDVGNAIWRVTGSQRASSTSTVH